MKDEFVKQNCIAIAKHHKENCDGDCGCSLIILGELLVKAGYKISPEEMEVFT